MVFVMPVLILHIVDMMAVQVIHYLVNLLFAHFAIFGEKSVARKACWIGRYINGNAAQNNLFAILYCI